MSLKQGPLITGGQCLYPPRIGRGADRHDIKLLGRNLQDFGPAEECVRSSLIDPFGKKAGLRNAVIISSPCPDKRGAQRARSDLMRCCQPGRHEMTVSFNACVVRRTVLGWWAGVTVMSRAASTVATAVVVGLGAWPKLTA